MIIPSKHDGYLEVSVRRVFGGGGGGPTSTNVTQSNIPDWLKPQVETLLGGATKQLFNTQQPVDPSTGKPQVDATTGQPVYDITGTKPFTPYSSDPSKYVAGFSPLQTQVQSNAANLQVPGQFNSATSLTGQSGLGGLNTAQQSLGYGGAGFQLGQQAANAGQNYANQASNVYNPTTKQYDTSSAISSYMSPYQQNVIDVQNAAAQRNADIASTSRGANFARSGAFGGSRQAIENAEANRALQTTMNTNQSTGLQNAYTQALQNMQFGNTLGLQGLQGGIQGAGVGLQGVSGAQAGYGLAGQAGTNLANVGTQQLGAQTGILGLQNQIGAQQQGQQQSIINQGIQNYANAQTAPMDAMNQYNAVLRGYALPGTTATQYQAAPAIGSQIAGLGTAGIAGLGLANAMKT